MYKLLLNYISYRDQICSAGMQVILGSHFHYLMIEQITLSLYHSHYHGITFSDCIILLTLTISTYHVMYLMIVAGTFLVVYFTVFSSLLPVLISYCPAE